MFKLPLYNPYTPALAVIERFSAKLSAFSVLLNGRTFGELEDADEVLLGLAIASELDTLVDVAEKFGFVDELFQLSRNGQTPLESYKTHQAARDAAKLYDTKLDANANISAFVKSRQECNEELEKLVAPSEQEQAA